ncbi:MAG: hypothetical protein WBL22_01520 [Candidatus Sulfotelmatobacter sp.]
MRKLATLLILSALATASAWAQSSEIPAPQTARQALMEMFSIKTSGTFVKHLPVATLSALETSGALKTLQQYSMLTSQFHTTGNQIETFETGPVLLATDDPKTGQKVEVVVESDSRQGDDDNIELSFRTYKDKQLQRTPFMPRITFAMKMESGVWKLNEILVTVRLPLADPDFLKSLTEGIKSRTAASAPIQTQSQPAQSQPAMLTRGFDASILAAMRSILTAEIAYSATYRPVGYTCTLFDLDGFGGGEPNEHQAMLIPSGLASGKRLGYVFTLSDCAGRPATGFRLAAAPGGNSFGRRAYCADQSGAIRYSADGNPATCLASGIPVQ